MSAANSAWPAHRGGPVSLVIENGPRKATLSKKQRLLSLENLHWAGFRGELALAVRQPMTTSTRRCRDSDTGDRVFKLGEVLEQLYALVPVAGTICVVGRARRTSPSCLTSGWT